MSNKGISVYADALERQQEEKATQEATQESAPRRDTSREQSRDSSRENPRNLPTRDDIQEFSFRLRDELRVKVQAEVPHGWQQELDDLARELKVKKMELYRFIFGQFLGKVEPPDATGKV